MSFQIPTKSNDTRKCNLPECGKEVTSAYASQIFCTTVCTQIFHQRAVWAKKRKKNRTEPKTFYARRSIENHNREENSAFNSKWLTKPLVA